MAKSSARQRNNRRTVTKLVLLAAAMFGFGFALVPLYDVFCEITGLNGKTGRLDAKAALSQVDTKRTVTIEFTGDSMAGLPWEFRPMAKQLNVHPGEVVEVRYYVRNTAGESITGQAVPSVAPARASTHFKKIECFCFTQQQLKAGEVREMPVRFVVAPELAQDVQTITLSYAFFNADKVSAAKYGGAVEPDHKHDGAHAHAGG